MASQRSQSGFAVSVSLENGTAVLALSGNWSLIGRGDSFESVLAAHPEIGRAGSVRVEAGRVETWDSRLLIFLLATRQHCREREAEFSCGELPDGVRRLLDQVPDEVLEKSPPVAWRNRAEAWSSELAGKVGTGFSEAVGLVGHITLGMGRVVRYPRRFRGWDCLEAMKQCGALALPIVGLISFLVGLIMAFQGVVQLRQFGAEVFVANLVGLAVVREMGPMMAAVVLAGRTGAAFAAQIGTMKVNEEIDALQTLGISPVDFLVMPRMLALTLMMPLLAIYANFLGIAGGMFVSTAAMDINAVTYLMQTREAIGAADVATGLIKSVVFGVLIAFAGCLRGLQCGRSSAGVGAAATSAVVTGILFIIIADAVFAVIYNQLGV